MKDEDDDVALKLLHTADWHLGLDFASFDEADRVKLTRARLQVVEQLLLLAESRQVDAVLCAGDLFDGPHPTDEWWKGLLQKFEARAWTDRPVFLLPGNHDPIMVGSVYHEGHEFRRRLPPWVHVVDRPDFEYALSDEAVLFAAPCTSQAGDTHLVESLPKRRADDARIRVGMIHGTTFDLPNHQQAFPIAKGAAVDRGLDYLAIGDTHAFCDVEPEAAVPTVYPGAPEPTRFGEVGAGHVALVLLRRSRKRARVQQLAVAAWRWRQESCDDVASLRALLGEPELERTVLRLKFRATLPAKEYEQAEHLLRLLKGTSATQGKVGILQLDKELTLDTSDLEGLLEELPEALQGAARRLQGVVLDSEVVDPPQAERARRALYHLYRMGRGGEPGSEAAS